VRELLYFVAVVRREASCCRVEVKYLDRRVVAAARLKRRAA
jgi:hypothetical protein